MDVVTGYQTWSDYISSQQQVQGFDKALQKQTKVLSVALKNQKTRQTVVEQGLGALGSELSHGIADLAGNIQFSVDRLAGGIDHLAADFNLLMGDVIWKLEAQSATLASILKTLQAPLDTQAKELRRRAEDAYGNGWYEEALNDFLESERKNYQDFAVHRSIGNIYLYHLIDVSKALEYFLKASKYSRPRDARQAAEAEYFIAIAYSIQRDFKSALVHMQEASELNPKFFDAFYMRAGFAALVGDSFGTTRSLETAIRGDARYHERAKFDPIFDNQRYYVDRLLDGLMKEVTEEAENAKRSIETMHARRRSLLPDGVVRLSELFKDAHEQFSQARTYKDYYEFTKLPQLFESEVRTAEKQYSAKKSELEGRIKSVISSIESGRRSQSRSKAEAAKGAALLSIVLVPVWSLAHCFTSVHNRAGGPPPPLGEVFPPAFMTAIVVSISIIVLAYVLAGRSEGKEIVQRERELERLRGELRTLG